MQTTKLEELTEEQEKLIEDLSQEWINFSNKGGNSIDEKMAKEAIIKIYALADLKEPEIVFAQGPMECMALSASYGDKESKTFDYLGSGFDSGWLSFLDFFSRIGIVEKSEDNLDVIIDFMKSGVWATKLYDGLAILIARPLSVNTDEQGRLHSDKSPAIIFADGYYEYCWHGTFVDEKVILRPETITQEDILNEKNSEVSRAIAERVGWDKYMQVMQTVLVDKWFDTKTLCHYELYDFKERRGELMPKLLKMESPQLNDGTRPYYIESVDPGLKFAESARKWQMPENENREKRLVMFDGKWMNEQEAVDFCNSNPALEFEIEA